MLSYNALVNKAKPLFSLERVGFYSFPCVVSRVTFTVSIVFLRTRSAQPNYQVFEFRKFVVNASSSVLRLVYIKYNFISASMQFSY